MDEWFEDMANTAEDYYQRQQSGLSSTAQQFFVDQFGYNPEAVNITRPDGVTDTAYLIGGREGFQPWPAKQVEAYVLYMQGGK